MSGRVKQAPPVGQRCLLILQRSLAIQLQRAGVGAQRAQPQAEQAEYWMYDSGYLLFQGFLEANLKCFWNASLLEAMKLLQYQGYVAPGVLLVTSSACALEVVRAAWARNVLMAPNNYVITVVGDVDDCVVQPLPQGQFTPLPEALCWVILGLTSAGQPAVMETIRAALADSFPAMQRPGGDVVYDALARLTADAKVYQTSQGYFVVTPERRRRRDVTTCNSEERRALLMSPDEARVLVHGEMATTRDGDVTHQAVQTNLADVICGGNGNDKVLYARAWKPRSRLERRHSLRLFASSKRLSGLGGRGGSLRHIARPALSDSSSSTEYPSTDSGTLPPPPTVQKKSSLLSRLFRRSKRAPATGTAPLATFAAQFPPHEWFNQRAVHLHSVGTQTTSHAHDMSGLLGRSTVSFATTAAWTDDDSSRAATLPRRRRRSADSLATRGSVFSPCKSSATTLSSDRSTRRDGSLNRALNRSLRHEERSLYNDNASNRNSRHDDASNRSVREHSAVSSLRNESSRSPRHSGSESRSPRRSSPHPRPRTPAPKPSFPSSPSSITLQFNSPSRQSDAPANTTTVSGSNTKIYVQQQNSPVRSLITFENGVNSGKKDYEDILIINEPEKADKENCVKEVRRPRSKLERPTSLYTPREAMKPAGSAQENRIKPEQKPQFPSVESLTPSEATTITNSEDGRKVRNFVNNRVENVKTSQNQNHTSHPNWESPSTVTCSSKTLNNARKLSNSSLSLMTRDGLIKNVFAERANVSPDKTFDSTGSFNNLFNNADTDKLPLEERAKFPSLSDLAVDFKSLAAQRILQGVSINSVDTLVEVNMAAEKKNNTVMHTDLGMV